MTISIRRLIALVAVPTAISFGVPALASAPSAPSTVYDRIVAEMQTHGGLDQTVKLDGIAIPGRQALAQVRQLYSSMPLTRAAPAALPALPTVGIGATGPSVTGPCLVGVFAQVVTRGSTAAGSVTETSIPDVAGGFPTSGTTPCGTTWHHGVVTLTPASGAFTKRSHGSGFLPPQILFRPLAKPPSWETQSDRCPSPVALVSATQSFLVRPRRYRSTQR